MFHKDPVHINIFPCYLSSIYGKELKVKRVNFHDYFGMDFDFCEKGAVKVSMIKYAKKIVDAFPE